MILHFSGTGNSAYVAKRIAEVTGDDAFDIFRNLRSGGKPRLSSDRPWVVVTPTYAWRIPHVVEDWLRRAQLAGSKDAYFVMTCGGGNGNAAVYLRKLCDEKGLVYHGCTAIVMPENYIAMFDAPAEAEAEKIIDRAEGPIMSVANAIAAGRDLPERAASATEKLQSGLVNSMFYPLFVHAKAFRSTDACVGCGACERVCPLGNVRMESGRPRWGSDCTHCMACICRCPHEAIEYGKRSVGQPRYVCPR